MYRRGHVGMVMLAYAPVGYLLLEEGRLALVLLGFLGVFAVERLPDKDFLIPFLTHRGVSHSLLCALVVGGVIGAVGWVVGAHLTPVIAGAVADLGLARVTLFDGPFQWVIEHLRRLDERALAAFGFAVGAFGIIAHLLADVITVAGIRPFLPFSRRRVSVSRIRADSSRANSALFVFGVFALAGVVVVSTVGVSVAAVVGGLAPADVAAGQPANQTQSGNQSQNASGNATAPTVKFSNQTTKNGSTITVKRATLPEGGFIVLSNDPYREVGILSESMIAVSKPLKPGTHRNVTLRVRRSPSGGIVNQTALNTTSDYSVGLYRDSNNNSQFDFITSAGNKDGAYTVGSGSNRRFAADTAFVTISGSNTPTPTASIRFESQSTNGSTVTVRSVTLPRGGFVVIHNGSYLRGGDPISTTIGFSRYLPAGTHERVTIRLLNGSVQRDQTLVAIPSQDTNDNQRYDYIQSDGFRDVPYTGKGGVITDRAQVNVSGGTPTPATPTTTSLDTTTPFRVTNISVSNRSAHVGDEVTVTAWIANPSKKRLEGELTLATAGTTVETQQVALFPRESREVRFAYSYDAPGKYVIKVANHTKRIRIVEEGAPLSPATTNATPIDAAETGEASGTSGEGGWLPDSPLVIVVFVLALVIVALVVIRRIS